MSCTTASTASSKWSVSLSPARLAVTRGCWASSPPSMELIPPSSAQAAKAVSVFPIALSSERSTAASQRSRKELGCICWMISECHAGSYVVIPPLKGVQVAA